MEPRHDERGSARKIMEEVPQEPIAADPNDEGETKDGADDGDEDEIVGKPVKLEDERE
jgi:hypothetical protein